MPALTSAQIAALPYRPCVGLVLLNGRGQIFAGQRIDSLAHGIEAWQMPQGGIDKGETPRAAALRELTEETGLPEDQVKILRESDQWLDYDLPEELIGKLWKGRYRGQTQRWFALRLTGPESMIDITRHDPEFARWDWMAAPFLIERIVPFKRAIYRAVFAEFADLL